MERIPFQEAVEEDLLFAKEFAKLSVPQRMISKAIYGCPLTKDELYYWSAFSGQGIYDELGFLTGIHSDVPYVPQEYADVTLIVGRRSGKSSSVSSLIIAYEALCGGHKARVGDMQDPVFLQVAQDLDTARKNLRQFIYAWLEKSPVGKKELAYYGSSARTADAIRLKHALITVGPPTIKLRGQAIACCAMDELGVWPKDREASNPDSEVQEAVEPALAQFYPFDKIIKTSTPMTEEGLLWTASQIGTRGCKLASSDDQETYKRTLVLVAPTAAMDNPVFRKVPGGVRSYLAEKQRKGADAFGREYLAQFAKSVSGFLNTDLIRESVAPAVRQRPRRDGVYYVATLDPAFRRDAFAVCVGHLSGGAFIQDYIHAWRGTKDVPLRPGAVLDEVRVIAAHYGISMLTSDQYHSDSLAELGLNRGLTIESVPMTGETKHKMWSDFNSLLMQRRLRLLDHPDMIDELMKMERTLTKYGNVQYSGGGRRDDLAMVTALAVHKAIQIGESRTSYSPSPIVSPVDAVRARIQSRLTRQQEGGDNAWWTN